MSQVSKIQRRVVLVALAALLLSVVAIADADRPGADSALAMPTTTGADEESKGAEGENEEPRAEEGIGVDPSPSVKRPDADGSGAASTAGGDDVASTAAAKRPNVVFVLSDDQPASAFSARKMPRTRKVLGRGGMTFTDAIAAPPLCCPYRAAFLSGQYAHNNGVNKNRPGYGALVDNDLVLPVFMQRAGYRTAFIGKFLNGTTAAIGPSPAPGWDHWFGMVGIPRYQGAEFSINGRTRKFGGRKHTTKLLTAETRSFIGRQSQAGNPFFVWLAHFAPHPSKGDHGPCAGSRTAKPGRGDYRFAKQFSFPRTGGNYNRGDRHGKPRWVSEKPSLRPGERRVERRKWHCALGASQQVDRSIAQVARKLKATGELANTWFVFGSDNGFHYGEHRLRGKRGTYEEMLRVPLVIRPPDKARFSSRRGTRSKQLVSQVDLAATILEVSGAEPCIDDRCRIFDGHSLVPLMANGGEPSWARTDRAVPIRLRGCETMALRTSKLTYIETRAKVPDQCRTETAFKELYQLNRDPGQVKNLVPDPRVRALQARLAALQRCSGVPERPGPIQAGRPHCE